MKTHHALLLVFAAALLAFGCQFGGFWTAAAGGDESTLPPDLVADTPRSYSGDFQYQTLLPVDLELTVRLFAPAARGVQPLASEEHLVLLTLTDSEGNRVWSGRIPPAGSLSATLNLPAAPEDMLLTLEAPGFETRSVTIRDMVGLSVVQRTMSLLQSAVQPRSLDLSDRDQDGIPDVYDAYPDDPDLAFSVREPADGYLTVAFEDLYPVPGDADYNDFVAKYAVIENYKNADPQQIIEVVKEVTKETSGTTLKTLHGEFEATAKIAGYNHMFGMVIDYPGLTPEKITVSFCDLFGNPQTADVPPMPDKAILWLFLSTKNAVGKKASFDIVFPDGVQRSQVSQAPYDPVLKVLQWDPRKSYDIHLIGRDPLPFSPDNPDETFMDSNGYPWALLVPDDWQHPAETQYIGQAYPLFDAWREAKGADFAYWYLYPASTNTDPTNNTPYPVTGPTTTPVFKVGEAATFQLDTTAPLGKSDDPDGDLVYFRSSPPPAALEGHFSLQGDPTLPQWGLVRFDASTPSGSYLMYFWSEDEHGASTITNPYKVTFSFQAATVAYPRIVIDTFSPNGSFTADTHIDLFGSTGDADGGDPWLDTDADQVLAAADDGGAFPTMARIDYSGGLGPGRYYIRVRGAAELTDDYYAIRVLSLGPSETVPAYDYAAYPLVLAGDLTSKADALEPDDDPADGFAMLTPATIKLGDANALSRSLHLREYLSATDYTGDVDWFELLLP